MQETQIKYCYVVIVCFISQCLLKMFNKASWTSLSDSYHNMYTMLYVPVMEILVIWWTTKYVFKVDTAEVSIFAQEGELTHWGYNQSQFSTEHRAVTLFITWTERCTSSEVNHRASCASPQVNHQANYQKVSNSPKLPASPTVPLRNRLQRPWFMILTASCRSAESALSM